MPLTKPLKVSVVGDLGTGKSALVHRLVYNSFAEYLDPYVEDTYRCVVDLDDGTKVSMIILDTVDEEMGDYVDQYAKVADSDVLILTYSVVQDASFNNLFLRCSRLQKLRDQHFTQGESVPKFLIVGTKSDLAAKRQVPLNAGRKLTQQFVADQFLECSAKKDYNVGKVFQLATELAVQKRVQERQERQEQETGTRSAVVRSPSALKILIAQPGEELPETQNELETQTSTAIGKARDIKSAGTAPRSDKQSACCVIM